MAAVAEWELDALVAVTTPLVAKEAVVGLGAFVVVVVVWMKRMKGVLVRIVVGLQLLRRPPKGREVYSVTKRNGKDMQWQ